MKNTFTVLFLVFWTNLCQSQQQNKGVLIDSITNQPVEFANIGLVEKGIGTVSNERGEYHFTIPDSAIQGNIRISMIGYKSKTIPAREFGKLNRVYLVQSVTSLNEVTVSSKKMQLKVLGNNTRSSVGGGFVSNMLGSEMAVKLRVKHPKTQLRKFMLNVNRNSLEKLPVFRFNVYAPDEKGYPGENILKQNIIIEPKDLVGFIEVDLKPYNIIVDKDIFISIEWIKDLGNATGLYFSTKLVGGATYFRNTSQDKWSKVSPIGVGLHAEVGY